MSTRSDQGQHAWRWGYVDEAQLRPRRAARNRSARHRPRETLGAPERQQGIALVVVMTAIAILTVLVAELMHSTSTSFHVTVSERDRVKAEYLAKSGLNLTRLLIANEPQIRGVVAPFYQLLTGRQPPQINVWDFANDLLAPFSDIELAKEMGAEGGIDFGQMEGMGETGGTFEIVTIPENSMINVNNPLFLSGDNGRRSMAMQLYALMGGYQSPDSPFDPMFSARDADGFYTTRLDIVSALIDWWDFDEQRTVFDIGNSTVQAAGSEDDIYSQLDDPYSVKNAPFDSLEEIRMIRGIGDDFWATFIESDPEDPRSRKITIYGSGLVNVNLAPADVLWARLCSFVTAQPLCINTQEAMNFIALFNTARAMVPISMFSSPADFINFVSGKGNSEKDLYPLLVSLIPGGTENQLLKWTPLVIPADELRQIQGAFLVSAAIFTIQSTAYVGRARAQISAVVNFHDRWTPPPPNTGKAPKLGVLHHYRID